MKSITFCWLLFFLTLSQFAHGQTGSVSGVLLDEEDYACEYVTLYLKNTSHGTLSDGAGRFKIENIAPGHYTLVCSGLSITTVELPVVVHAEADTFIHIRAARLSDHLRDVVVTATRTEKVAEDLPIPVKVISGDQIRRMGALRLSDVLCEQTGLVLVNDHGVGLQMQGFSSEYTLILLNGEPLIGRTAGTFDLSRIAVGNIKKIEIVKGPSSSLYGSEALAGVVNIITETPGEKLSGNLRTRYGSFNTLGVSADVSANNGKAGIYLFADRYSTAGYKLGSSEEHTVPPYQNYTFQTGITYKVAKRLAFVLNGRLSFQNQSNSYSVNEEGGTFSILDKGHQNDWNVNPRLTWTVSDKEKFVAHVYTSGYAMSSVMNRKEDGSLYDESVFRQRFTRPELQYSRRWRNDQETVAGAGAIAESVEATRYTSEKRFYSIYVYLQHDVTLFKKINVITGVRYDQHSVYGSQLNPKVSASYKLKEKFSLRGSVGRGFKAPDFRQLYLNFNNSVEGYSVLGSEEVKEQLIHLQQTGLIRQILIEPSALQPVKAESSVSWNLGWLFQPSNLVSWQVNFFRNDIKDMIATSAVAIKTNGGSIFSYFNIARVYTEGFETDISYKVLKDLRVSVGYQYMIAKDKQVVEDIRNGLLYRRDPETLKTTRVKQHEYGGLFNRSRHMLNVKAFYTSSKGWTGNIRGVYRGRYGFADTNGNLIADIDNEYVKGYWLWNISAGKKCMNSITIQCGIDNVFDFKRPMVISTIPGRIYYLSLELNLNKKNLKRTTQHEN
jgi:outer membrane receptor for ferrienterochelin and colicins